MTELQEAPAAVPAFGMTVAGTALPTEARGMVTKIVVRDSIDRASTFAVELDNWDMAEEQPKWSDGPLFDPGGSVVISLGYEETVEPVIDGEITGLEVAFAERGGTRLTVRGYDRLHRLRRGRRTRSYLQAKDSDVAQQIAGDLGLTPDVEQSSEVHDYLLQMNQTDIDFLHARARAIGYELRVTESTLTFRASKHDLGMTTRFDPTHGLVSFHAYLSTADQVSQVDVRGWDPGQKQALVGQAQASAVTGTMNGTSVGPATAESLFGAATLTLVEHPVATQGEADLLAQGVLDEIALGYVTAEATVVGAPAVKAGTVVEFGGLGARFNGLYYVDEARHVWDNRYVTHLELRRNAA